MGLYSVYLDGIKQGETDDLFWDFGPLVVSQTYQTKIVHNTSNVEFNDIIIGTENNDNIDYILMYNDTLSSLDAGFLKRANSASTCFSSLTSVTPGMTFEPSGEKGRFRIQDMTCGEITVTDSNTFTLETSGDGELIPITLSYIDDATPNITLDNNWVLEGMRITENGEAEGINVLDLYTSIPNQISGDYNNDRSHNYRYVEFSENISFDADDTAAGSFVKADLLNLAGGADLDMMYDSYNPFFEVNRLVSSSPITILPHNDYYGTASRYIKFVPPVHPVTDFNTKTVNFEIPAKSDGNVSRLSLDGQLETNGGYPGYDYRISVNCPDLAGGIRHAEIRVLGASYASISTFGQSLANTARIDLYDAREITGSMIANTKYLHIGNFQDCDFGAIGPLSEFTIEADPSNLWKFRKGLFLHADLSSEHVEKILQAAVDGMENNGELDLEGNAPPITGAGTNHQTLLGRGWTIST